MSEEIKDKEIVETDNTDSTDVFVVANNEMDDAELDELLTKQKQSVKEVPTPAEPEVKPDNPEDSKVDEPLKPEDKKEDNPLETTDNTVVVVNDEYIASQPEEVQEILKAARGKRQNITVDAQVLKNYINEQQYIPKLKNEVSEYQKKISEYEEQFKQQETERTQKYEIDEKERDELVLKQLRSKWSAQGLDIPENPEEFEEFLSDIATTKIFTYNKIVGDMNKIQQNVERDLEEIAYVKNNYEKVVNDTLGKAKQDIISYFKEANVDNIEEILGKEEYNFADLSKGANKLLKELTTENGRPDSSVVSIYGTGDNKLVLISPKGLRDKYIAKYGSKIFKSYSELVRAQGVTDGITKKNITEAPPSIANSSTPKKIEQPKVKSFVADVDDTDEEIDKKNQELKRSILGRDSRF